MFDYRSLYKMSKNKLLVLKKYLKDNLYKRFIWVNTFLIASLILFTWKPSSSLCFYIDYQKLNAITIKNCYLISLI